MLSFIECVLETFCKLNVVSQVRRTLAQVIITMAHHEYLSLEGGDSLVKFIIQQCAIPDSVC